MPRLGRGGYAKCFTSIHHLVFKTMPCDNYYYPNFIG